MKKDYTILNFIKKMSWTLMVSCCCLGFNVESLTAQTCNTAPVIVCPTGYNGCPTDDTSPSNTGFATASPGEAGCVQPVVTFTEQIFSTGTCTGEVTIGRTWRADYPNNSNPWLFADCTQLIVTIDEAIPEITNCPTDITIGPNENCEAIVTWVEPTPSDDCQVVSFTSNFANGSTFPKGTTTVTYTATDICGKTAMCSFDVIVAGSCCFDAPVVICPSAYYGCPESDSTPQNTGFASFQSGGSGCDDPILDFTDQFVPRADCTGEGTIIRTWTVTDPNNNSYEDQCVQRIVLFDDNPPRILNCPDDITATEGDMISWNEPIANNRCGIVSFEPNIQNNTVFNVGCQTVTYTAVDRCGNTTSCSFEVCVQASNICDTAPVIICPSQHDACPGIDVEPTVTGYPVANPGGDNCGNPELSYSDELVTTYHANGAREIHRTWTAKDAAVSGLSSSCMQIIIRNDNTNPAITSCPGDISLTCGETIAHWTAPSYTDNCHIANVSSNYDSGDSFPIGTTTVIYTITDECGNVATCSFDVIVCAPTCQTIPTIVCPDNYTNLCPGANITATGSGTGVATAYNNGAHCNTPLITYNDVLIADYSCDNADKYERTWTATDPNNAALSAHCVQVIIRKDVDDPIITNCPTDIIINSDNCIANWNVPTVSDNCDLVSFTSNYEPGHTFPEGTTTVIYTATDACNNISQCSFTVTCNAPAVCIHNPIISCPDIYIGCVGETISPNNTGWATSSPGGPNCATPTITWSDVVTTGTCNGEMQIERTWMATDPSNSSLNSSCVQVIILKDDQDPQFTNCPQDIIITSSDCTATWSEPTAWDNCGIEQLSSTYSSGYSFPYGTTTVTYTAIDKCGNMAQCSFTVTCNQPAPTCNVPPTLICPDPYSGCPNGSVHPNTTGTATATAGSTACGTPIVTHNDVFVQDFDCNGSAKWARTWTAVDPDNSNLSSSCVQLVMLLDQDAPVITNCPSDITISNDACTTTWQTPTFHDNCGTPTVSVSHQSGSVFPTGTTEVVYTVTDNCGNVSHCTFTVTCQAPSGSLNVHCPDDINVMCDNQNGSNTCWPLPTYDTDCTACNQGSIPGFMYMGTYNGHKYYCSLAPDTWQNAKNVCQSYGGYLAVINNQTENQFLANILTLQSAYIGLSDHVSEGTFEWCDGSPLSYTNWYPGQPNNYNNAQDYCEMLSNGQWNDQYAHSSLEYIMELPCVTITQTGGPSNCSYLPVGTNTITYTVEDLCGNVEQCSFNVNVEEGLNMQCVENTTITCPAHTSGVTVNWQEPIVNSCCSVCYGSGGEPIDGFMYMGSYGGSHYYCSTAPALWPDAQNICKENGGNLAIIEGEGENEFLAEILTIQSAYIGCSDAEEEGHFVWVDGSGIEYSNWYPGQPNNYNDSQDYVEMLSNGQWNDQYNGKPLEFIMEVDGCVSVKQIAGPPNGSYLPLGCTEITYEATDACGNIDYCTFDLCVVADYCQSGGQTASHAWVKNVSFGGINNTTGSNGGYANFSNSGCGTVQAGQAYSLSVMPGFPGAAANVYWQIFIDYNMDGDFGDQAEFIAAGSGAHVLSGNITVPAWISSGETRMRVVMKKGSMPSGPCSVFGYGETEDYCINLWAYNDVAGDDDVSKSKTSKKSPKTVTLTTDSFVFSEDRSTRDQGEITTRVEIFPNPAAEYLKVYIDDIQNVEVVNIYASDGSVITTWDQGSIENYREININSWLSGMYVMKIEYIDGTSQMKKIIKQE